jgi:hypothetical protein
MKIKAIRVGEKTRGQENEERKAEAKPCEGEGKAGRPGEEWNWKEGDV